jgi:4-amino-4-deoxy-L-arabinose transferase-like glycosyltransferase
MKKIRVVSILVVLFALTGFYCYHFFGGYEGLGDGNDYAGLARSIVRGEGFNLGHIYPLALVFNPQIPQPDNIWAPGYPVYLALWFEIFGANDESAVFASIFALWLLILAGYLLGKKVLNEGPGLIVAALIGLSQVVLYAAVEGTPEILTGALLAYSLIVILGKQDMRRMFFSGIIFSTAIMTRYQMAVIAVPLAVIFIDDKKKMLPLWGLAAIVGVTPWLLRNMIVLGNPLFTLQSFGEYTKGMGRFDDFYYTYRSFAPMTLRYALSHFPFDVIKKFVAGLVFFGGSFPLRFNYLGIVPFFFALLNIGRMNGRQKQVVLFAFISALLVIILSSLDGHHDRHLIPLQAFFAVSILTGFILMAKEFAFFGRRRAMIILTALLFLPPRFPFQEMSLSKLSAESRSYQQDYKRITDIVRPDEVIISDGSDAIWWYADRSAIWIPGHYGDIKELFKRDDCDYLYLTRPIEFMSRLNDDDLFDFTSRAEPVADYAGYGGLYKLNKDNGPISGEK